MSDRAEYAVPVEEARARLDVFTDEESGRKTVHTFVGGGFGLIGADWDLDELLELMRERGVERAGSFMSGMRHGLVVLREDAGDLFLATRDE